jgi:hypothetical protein
MKKLILLMIITIAVMDYGCRESGDYVITGQLYLSGRHTFPDKLKGRVQQLTQNNFDAKEENGKLVKGKFTAGIVEQYNESGIMSGAVSIDSVGNTRSNDWSIKAEIQGGKLIKEMYYQKDTLRAYCNNTYDGNNLTEMKFYNPENDTLIRSVVYSYDKQGNRIKFQLFNSKNEPGNYQEFVFNTSGFLEHNIFHNADGKITLRHDHVVNSKGVRIASQENNPVSGLIIDYIFTYEYDKRGNWTRIVFIRDNKPVMVRERQLKYYD